MAVSRLFGASIRRREDPRLITGQATYCDDIQLANMAYAVIVRQSPCPHAPHHQHRYQRSGRSSGGHRRLYRQRPGGPGGQHPVCMADSRLRPRRARPPAAGHRHACATWVTAWLPSSLRIAGRPPTRLIWWKSKYEELPAIVDQEKATAEGAPQLHDDVPSNTAFRWKMGEWDDEAFENAEVTVSHRFHNQRLIPNSMEARGAVAQWDAGAEEMTIWLTSQNPHIHRVLMSGVLGIPEHKLRIGRPGDRWPASAAKSTTTPMRPSSDSPPRS